MFLCKFWNFDCFKASSPTPIKWPLFHNLDEYKPSNYLKEGLDFKIFTKYSGLFMAQ
jgi:hypothetical protein